ncbi:MAG: HIT family protein, partial [Peptidiphaga gingivicola]
ILVCTYRHVSLYTDLTDEERIEMGSMTARAMEALGEALRPAGFNLGMNQGDVAGAGIAAHIHQHVVPRWLGDANFLPIIAQTKAIPAILADTRNLVSEAWSRIDRGSTGEGSMRGGATGKGPAREDPAGEEGSGNAQ